MAGRPPEGRRPRTLAEAPAQVDKYRATFDVGRGGAEFRQCQTDPVGPEAPLDFATCLGLARVAF